MEKEQDMPRVRFTATFDYTPKSKPSMSVHYKAGFEGLVPHAHADAAIAKGKADMVQPAGVGAESNGDVVDQGDATGR